MSLTNFSPGVHQIACFSNTLGNFGHYQTSNLNSAGCPYKGSGSLVWVKVDQHYQSNVITWV